MKIHFNFLENDNEIYHLEFLLRKILLNDKNKVREIEIYFKATIVETYDVDKEEYYDRYRKSLEMKITRNFFSYPYEKYKTPNETDIDYLLKDITKVKNENKLLNEDHTFDEVTISIEAMANK